MASSQPAVDPVVTRLLDELEGRLDLLVARIVDRASGFDAGGGGYAEVPRDELTAAAGVLSRAAIASLRDGRSPTQDELAQARILGERRASQDISMEDLLRTFRIAAREALEEIKLLGGDLDVEATIDLAAALWDWIDEVAVTVAQAHRSTELARARRDSLRRATILYGLVHGTLIGRALDEAVTAVGLDVSAEHLVVRLRPRPDHGFDELERLLVPRPWSPGLVAQLDDELVALLPEPPQEVPVPAGLGSPAHLSAIAASYREAGRALETASAYELSGAHSLHQLPLRAAVIGDPAVSSILRARFIDPVRALGAFGDELLTTLRVYARHRQSVDAAAAELHVHPNTLRHRLTRFEETTGAELRDPAQLAEVWWALSADDLEC